MWLIVLAEYIKSTLPSFSKILFAVLLFQYFAYVLKPFFFVIFSTFEQGSIPITFFLEKFFNRFKKNEEAEKNNFIEGDFEDIEDKDDRKL